MSEITISPSAVQDSDSEFLTTTSANKFKTVKDFVQHVYSVVAEVKQHRVFLFTEVHESWSKAAFEAIDEFLPYRQTLDPYNRTMRIKVRPELLHQIAHQFIPLMIEQWRYVDQILTQPERDLLMISGSASWQKDPDYSITVDGHRFPIFVVEPGWFESNTKLFDEDMNKLLVSGSGAINLVALLKWRKLSDNRVSGSIKLYKRDNANYISVAVYCKKNRA
ncbi:unnamed protein product [Penicillium pancosmium]